MKKSSWKHPLFLDRVSIDIGIVALDVAVENANAITGKKFLDEFYRIQSCEDLQQDLVYAEALDRQCKENTDHIFCQRDKRA